MGGAFGPLSTFFFFSYQVIMACNLLGVMNVSVQFPERGAYPDHSAVAC